MSQMHVILKMILNQKLEFKLESFAQFYFGDKTKANPYFYGYTPEITVDKNGET